MSGLHMVILEQMLSCPTTMKILLALLDEKQAYQSQLARLTGGVPPTILTALAILMDAKLITTTRPERPKKNTKDFYELTARGHHVANHLKELARSLENGK